MTQFQLWLSRYPYATAVLGTLAVVTLLVTTDGFIGVRRSVQAVGDRMEERRLAREAQRYVWCFSRLHTQDGNTIIYGHFPGYRTRDVLRFNDTPSQLLAARQERNCYPSWHEAAEANDALARDYSTGLLNGWQMPQDHADEEAYQQAILTSLLDHPRITYRAAATPAVADAAERWCMSRLLTTDYALYYVPHAVGERGAVEAILHQLPDRSHLTQYRIDETACFARDADALDWLAQSGFAPAAGSTLTTYLDNVSGWLNQEPASR